MPRALPLLVLLAAALAASADAVFAGQDLRALEGKGPVAARSSGAEVTVDDNGNLTDDGTRLYAYDYKNRLVGVVRKADSRPIALYGYLPDGRRSRKQVWNPDTGALVKDVRLLSDGPQEVEEQDWSTGTTLTTYVWSPVYVDELVSFTNAGGTFYAHQDARCDVVAITNGSGAVVERRRFDDFGRVEVRDGAGAVVAASPSGCDYGFQGRKLDPETGLVYFRARYYDPATGRFVQRDPVWDAGNVGGQYTFCGNGPVSGLDPSGEFLGSIMERARTMAGHLERGDLGAAARQVRDDVVGAFMGLLPGTKPLEVGANMVRQGQERMANGESLPQAALNSWRSESVRQLPLVGSMEGVARNWDDDSATGRVNKALFLVDLALEAFGTRAGAKGVKSFSSSSCPTRAQLVRDVALPDLGKAVDAIPDGPAFTPRPAPGQPAPGQTLRRYGADWESAAELNRQAQLAERDPQGVTGGIHGVSATTKQRSGKDISRASKEKVEEHFRVHDTPTIMDPKHRTIELPKPVTPDVAALFNRLFGREEPKEPK